MLNMTTYFMNRNKMKINILDFFKFCISLKFIHQNHIRKLKIVDTIPIR
jgi:hypothetical protein